MPEAFTAGDFVVEAFVTEVFTTGPFLASGDFGVRDLDMVSSVMATQHQRPRRLLSLLSHSLRPLFWRQIAPRAAKRQPSVWSSSAGNRARAVVSE